MICILTENKSVKVYFDLKIYQTDNLIIIMKTFIINIMKITIISIKYLTYKS